MPKYVTTSKALAQIPNLTRFLDGDVKLVNQFSQNLKDTKAVLAWGKKPSAAFAERYAKKTTLPLLRVEDAFLRSVEIGAFSPPLGLIVDDLGIYYDARSESRLEKLIITERTQAEVLRARKLIDRWRDTAVSKYNQGSMHWEKPAQPFVLVIDQTFGDASVEFGLASSVSFERMLETALSEYPEHLVIIKTHPDVIAGVKKGYLTQANASNHPRVSVEAGNIHPPVLLKHAEAVFCVTSQVGFEALLWGKPVFCFGVPFFSGWGLTQDMQDNEARFAVERRRKMTSSGVTLEQITHAALIDYAQYVHPETKERCEVESLLDWLALQLRMRNRFTGKLALRSPPKWKRAFFLDFFQGSSVRVVKPIATVGSEEKEIVWGAREKREQNVVRVEDGFIRSVGLGGDLIRPLSWVIDDVGMYYDATRPSKLENLIQHYNFDSEIKSRAEVLIDSLLSGKLTKYNVGVFDWKRPNTSKPILLVPGQVESDASIEFGSPVIRTNLELLKRVREARPDAYIVYKPHPDVVAGLRKRGDRENAASHWADEIVTHANMADMLEHVDEIHTLTSLTGFEALLRNVKVTCYGQPFYSGWGLTHDIYPQERRQRKVSLAELVAASLILYPTYISRETSCYCTAERAVLEMQMWRK